MRNIILYVSLVFLLVGVSAANTAYLDSAPGLAVTCYNTPASLPCATTVAITPHSSWQANHPVNPGDPNDTSAIWVSYAHTGVGPDSDFQPYEGTNPVVSVFEYFTSGPGTLTLNVWSDDTADVILDGTYLFVAQFTQSTCSGQPIGCLPDDAGIINMPISAGSHTLEFVMYQVGTGTTNDSNPFGLLFTGTVTPEPSAMLLLGSGLLGLIGTLRRIAHKS